MPVYSEDGSHITSDEVFDPESPDQSSPEAIGKRCATRLLDELYYVKGFIQSGYVDTTNQSMFLILMALTERKISKILLGRVSAYTAETLRLLKDVLGVVFNLTPQEEGRAILSCIGLGLENISRIVK